MTVPLWMWLVVVAAILVMLAVDLLGHRGEHVIGPRAAAAWTGIWVALGLGFGGLTWLWFGPQAAGEYLAGYLIEKSLAVDNIVVLALLLTAFAVPRAYQHKVLFLGVLGALLMRAAFIAAGAALIERFAWVLYLFGGFLVVTGVQLFRHRGRSLDPARNPLLRITLRLVPSTAEYHGGRLLVRCRGRWLATPLLTALVLVEVLDLVFAVDSIPAVFAVTTEPFLVFTSNAFAVLGLRSLYFLLADLIHRFVHLKAGLAAVLVFVGGKLLLLDLVHVPITLSLTMIAVLIGGSVLASLWSTRDAGPGQGRVEPGVRGPGERPDPGLDGRERVADQVPLGPVAGPGSERG